VFIFQFPAIKGFLFIVCLYGPYFPNFCAFAIANGIILVAGMVPSPPARQDVSENERVLSGRQNGA
jgi:hypothetical protein